MSSRSEKLQLVENNVKSYPDFPKPGILFRDIFGVFGNPEAAAALYSIIYEDCQQLLGKVSAVCGLDARGFLFGPQIAAYLKVPFVPIRKKGKLPGSTASVKFELEYGSDQFEIQQDHLLKGGNVILVDDLLATGGSLKAAGSLVETLGCQVKLCFVIMELEALNARSTLSYTVHSILRF